MCASAVEGERSAKRPSPKLGELGFVSRNSKKTSPRATPDMATGTAMPSFRDKLQGLERPGLILDRLGGAKRRRAILSALGRFLLVLTFIEDGMRIIIRWDSQMRYLTEHLRRPWVIAAMKLLACAVVELGGSALILRPRQMRPNLRSQSAYTLLVFLAVQPALFGAMGDAEFVGRSVGHIGGLLLLIWSERDRDKRRSGLGLEAWDGHGGGVEREDWMQLAGRALLTVVFLAHPLLQAWATPTTANICAGLGLFGLSVAVLVGFKTELSALVLMLVLGCSDSFLYAYWRLPTGNPQRDIKKYFFFQTLAIMGGLILLALHGPGEVSVERKWGRKKGL